MKTKIKNTLPLIIVTLMLLAPTLQVVAQGPCASCCGSTNPAQIVLCESLNCDCPEPIPLDGGLSALLIAGIAYGAKRIYGKDKSKK